MPEPGSGSAAGRATPERARVKGDATTPARTRDTLHMHGVADTAKRRVRGSQKGSKKRQIVLRNEALAEEAAAVEAKRACAEPDPDI